MKVSGFTIVRNAKILDYPFPENVLSILPLCDEFIIHVGDSEDDTRAVAEAVRNQYPAKIRIIDSVWKTADQAGGAQLREQTNAALSHCRGDWCFYIQADEVIHEADFPKIREALLKASQKAEIEGILFEYLHFYGNYDYTIKGRNWYRREVRLFRNGRAIEAFRDAQGFRIGGKRLAAICSGARVFHYGYVRSVEGIRQKSQQMSQWWGETPETNLAKLRPKRHVGLRRFGQTHPAIMSARIDDNHRFYDPSKAKRSWNLDEFKNAITLFWESIVPYRIGEFRNYKEVRG